MRALGLFLTALAAACGGARGPAAVPAAAPDPCALAAADSAWFSTAVEGWRRTETPRLGLVTRPLPPIVLFDPHCVYHIAVGARWAVSADAHDGSIRLPNGRHIAALGIGITSPTLDDTAFFVALALPDVWRHDPRYKETNDSRGSWERYLVGAFIHEMTHARMLPTLLPRLRALEAEVYPDTIEDNAIQNRFGRDREFAASVARETEFLYQAALSSSRRMQREYARAALGLLRERRQRYYVEDLQPWAELEQTFLDLEGVAQWAAFHHSVGNRPRGAGFERALMRFRAGKEFWSEDQGLALILVLDALVPGWQRRMFAPAPMSSLELLAAVVGPTS